MEGCEYCVYCGFAFAVIVILAVLKWSLRVLFKPWDK